MFIGFYKLLIKYIYFGTVRQRAKQLYMIGFITKNTLFGGIFVLVGSTMVYFRTDGSFSGRSWKPLEEVGENKHAVSGLSLPKNTLWQYASSHQTRTVPSTCSRGFPSSFIGKMLGPSCAAPAALAANQPPVSPALAMPPFSPALPLLLCALSRLGVLRVVVLP